MSLAADVAKNASNMNKALTLSYIIGALEEHESAGAGRYVRAETILEMIHEDLSSREVERVKLINDERVKRELQDNPKLIAEVVT